MPRRRLSSFLSSQGFSVLLLGLLVTFIFFVGIRAFEFNRTSFEFERQAETRIAAVRGAMQEASEVLSNVNRLFRTAGPINREQFHAFTQPMLEQNPHLRSIAFQRVLSDSERPQFEAALQEKHAGFRITELVDGKPVSAGKRAHYRVIEYLEPMSGNEAAFGLDAGSRQEQDDAARQACETDRISATRLYRLAQEPDVQRGFVMLMPVYQTGTVPADAASRCRMTAGYTTVTLRGTELVEKTLGMRRLPGLSDVDLSVYANGIPNEDSLAFRIGAAPLKETTSSFLNWFSGKPHSVSQTFDVAGRQWHMVVSPAPGSVWDAHWHLGSWLTLIVGTFGSVLAAIYMHTLASRSHHIQRMVEERTATLRQVNESLKLREQAIEACVNAIIITSADAPDYPIEYVNPAFEKVTGYARSEVLGKSCSLLWKNDHAQSGVKEIVNMIRQKREVKATLRTYRKDGSLFWSEVYIAPVEDDSGEVNHFVVAHYDITETKRHEKELEQRANHDALTGIANRKLLHERLEQAIAHAAREGQSAWVMFIDIDRFKFVNDSFGHHAGDLFLKTIAERLQSLMGESDTVARGGGDEFVLIVSQADQPGQTNIVQRVMDVIAEPLTFEGRQLFLTCSAGVAVYPSDGGDPDTLIQHADLAMYRAKELGRNNCQFYTRAMNERAQEYMKVEYALREAMERDEFLLLYQPQVDLSSGRVVGMEALLRSRHPDLAAVAPNRLIHIAEETGLIVPIGEWVLRTACKQAKAWQAQGLGDFRIAVNLSVRQFLQPGIANLVAGVLQETELPGSLLEIELTESLVMSDVERAIDVLAALRALGVQLAIDDFGTGYSSLAYLKRFPIDVLKIDQSFVGEISPHSNDAAISDAIISMAHSLGMRVIAEGVETELQCEYLSRNMCDEIQGYLFSKALPAPEIEALLTEGRCLPGHLLRLQKRPRTLLLVDDEPNILAALRRLMRSAGYRILTAGSGQEALELLAQNEVDVIVSDQRMPGMTGVELLRNVKTLYPETVRIVLSGFTELQSVTDAVNEGAIYKFLTKPWDDAQLREHVEKAFQHKEMADENCRLDMEVRSANRELAKTNRQLEEVLKQKQQMMQRNEITLDIVREALQHVALPIVGLDEEEIVAFANIAAQDLFKGAGMILGSEAEQLMPDVLRALRGAEDGEKRRTELHGARFDVVSRSMGKGTQSRGRLIMLSASAEA